jgi:NO-binding membrane sensor protein with MHYT domain
LTYPSLETCSTAFAGGLFVRLVSFAGSSRDKNLCGTVKQSCKPNVTNYYYMGMFAMRVESELSFDPIPFAASRFQIFSNWRLE